MKKNCQYFNLLAHNDLYLWFNLKEGIKFLEKNDPDLAEECKTVTKETAKNGAGDAPEVAENGSDKPKMARDNTMVTTAQASWIIYNLLCRCVFDVRI